jgi:hypothetical protein
LAVELLNRRKALNGLNVLERAAVLIATITSFPFSSFILLPLILFKTTITVILLSDHDQGRLPFTPPITNHEHEYFPPPRLPETRPSRKIRWHFTNLVEWSESSGYNISD